MKDALVRETRLIAMHGGCALYPSHPVHECGWKVLSKHLFDVEVI
jgi:hypothetical protein